MWPLRSQEAALAWQVEQASRDPQNGTFDWEWEEDPDAYEAKVLHSDGEFRKVVEWDRWKAASGADRNPDLARGKYVALRRRTIEGDLDGGVP